MSHTYAPMTIHHDHGWLVVSDVNDDVYVKIAKGLGTEKEQSLAKILAVAPTLLQILCEMLGVAQADCMDTKSNVWRNLMISAESVIEEATRETK